MTIFLRLLTTPAGDLLLGEFENQLCLCDWVGRRNRQAFDKRLSKRLKTDFDPKNTALLSKASQELTEYFAGERQQFSVPVLLSGTEFQLTVWHALQQIPYGKTSYYQLLAQSIGKPTAIRAVANAIGANPMSIIVPCHRVLRKDKQLSGYAGGIGAKRTLLNLEHTYVN